MSRSVNVYLRPSDETSGSFAAEPGIGLRVFASSRMRPSKTIMVWATSLTNDSFCGSMVSGSEPVFVVSSPFGSAAPACGPPC